MSHCYNLGALLLGFVAPPVLTSSPPWQRFGENLRAENKDTRLHWAHGTQDGIVNFNMQEYGVAVLKESGIEAEVKKYPMAHTATDKVLSDVASFMESVMKAAGPKSE